MCNFMDYSWSLFTLPFFKLTNEFNYGVTFTLLVSALGDLGIYVYTVVFLFRYLSYGL